ncbi:MAG: hypothetical protein E4H27_10390 [Anaerolineales bacterium]|nr:MAG: hypothetical protein E4H27_10390 [Anaerolineales bacterium]
MTEQERRKLWGLIALSVLLLSGAGYLFFVDIPPVVLSWETASEVGTAGFNVYRADSPAEQFVQVTADLIPAEGDELLGAAYRYEDYAVSTAKQYVYRIEEVEWDGTRQLYPETVNVRAGLTRVWRQLESGVLGLLAIMLLWRGFTKK